MENFQGLMKEFEHINQQDVKSQSKQFEELPEFLKAGLTYHKKYVHLRKQPFLVQFFVSQILKKQGNCEIEKQKYQIGFHKYEQSLAIFRYIEVKQYQSSKDQHFVYHIYKPESQYTQMLSKHLNSLYLNISLCAIKQNKKQQALLSADQALKIDKNNPKSYYCKSQAYLNNINKSQKDIKQGLKYLEITYQLSKQEEIHHQIIKMKRLIQEDNKKHKQNFRFMINNNNTRLSVLSDSIKYKYKQDVKMLKKGNSRSAEKKKQQTISFSQKNGIMKQTTVKNAPHKQEDNNAKTINSHNSINTNHNNKESKLVEKNLKQIKLKQEEKSLKTQRKLLKMLENDNWELTLLENTILKTGQKILVLLDVYNYNEYIEQYKIILKKCMNLQKKSVFNKDSYRTQQGQQITIDLQEAQVKGDQQKIRIYNEYISWLYKHPIPEITKYLERYQNQKRFLIQKYRQRQEKKIVKIIEGGKNGGTDDKEGSSNMTVFYSAALVILIWMVYNIYRNLIE